jgi:hypothetical protein
VSTSPSRRFASSPSGTRAHGTFDFTGIAESELEPWAACSRTPAPSASSEDKLTNEDLYLWMAGELQSTYHQAYKLAFDMARRAERAYQFERG